MLPVRPSATTKTQGNAAMAEQDAEEAEAAEEELGVDACMVDGGVADAIVLRAGARSRRRSSPSALLQSLKSHTLTHQHHKPCA